MVVHRTVIQPADAQGGCLGRESIGIRDGGRGFENPIHIGQDPDKIVGKMACVRIGVVQTIGLLETAGVARDDVTASARCQGWTALSRQGKPLPVLYRSILWSTYRSVADKAEQKVRKPVFHLSAQEYSRAPS